MDVLNSLLIFLLVISFVSGLQQANGTASMCDDVFTNTEKQQMNKSEVDDMCMGKHCIAKCCVGKDTFMFVNLEVKSRNCLNKTQLQRITNKTIEFDYSVEAYEGSSEVDARMVTINLKEYQYVHNMKFYKSKCWTPIFVEPQSYHIFNNHSLIVVRKNYYRIFIHKWDFGNFCFEQLLVRNRDGSFKKPFVMYRTYMDVNNLRQQEKSSETHKIVTLILSCISLVLVLIVYALISELRNLNGMVLIAYVSTLFFTFFLRVVMLLGLVNRILMDYHCQYIGVILYYMILSTFFWMNIMSLDIWWSFRGMYKSRAIHRKGEVVKFCWYASYAWGVPSLLAIIVGWIDNADLSHKPRFFKPHFEHCFFYSEEDDLIELRFYLYVPILILLLINLIFFLMTAFNIWRINRSNKILKNKYNDNSIRFCLYLKLSLVMGINWIFETLTMPTWLQFVAALYNGLTGVAIFFIFVVKWSIIEKVCNRLHIKSELVEKMRRRSSAATTTTSQGRKKSSIEDTTITDISTAKDSKRKSLNETIALSTVDE